MRKLEERLGYTFQDKALLETALTHSSFANEHKNKRVMSNERLEFLGDSVLGMIVARRLYADYPDMPEGQMTRFRADLVCEESLVTVSKKLGLGVFLRLGKGEESGGGRSRPSIMADAVEALLAAVYLDGGMEAAGRMVETCLLSDIQSVYGRNRDYKTALQELVQRAAGQVISYHLLEESGPDHNKMFRVEVCLNGKSLSRGEGKNKKEAEQMAAKTAIEEINGV